MKIFSPMLWVAFFLPRWCPLKHKGFLILMKYDLFSCLYFRCHIQESIAKSKVTKIYLLLCFGSCVEVFDPFWVYVYIWCEVRVQLSSFACGYLVVQPCFKRRKRIVRVIWSSTKTYLSPVHRGSPLANQSGTGRVNFHSRRGTSAVIL